MKKWIELGGTIMLLLCCSTSLYAQQQITLEEVWRVTRAHYPLDAQRLIIQEIGQSTLSALTNAYL
ncbi:MAG: hypothetical protein Q4D93_04815, partial [Porphyromonas sp.]|nr:hypothetical protein [Porphyromonas sp.]